MDEKIMLPEAHFGDAETPLPNWREVLPEEDDDSDELPPEERAAVVGMIGFDPAEVAEADEEEGDAAPPQVKASPFKARDKK